MATSDPPLQALTIFLLRELEDPVKSIKGAGRLQRIPIDGNHLVFIKRPPAHAPSWARFFAGRIDPERFGRVKSSAAVLLTKAGGRDFALVFGSGRHLLDPQSYEQRFGLLVTLNAVDPKKVRSIDKASLDRQGMQSRIQAGRDASARDFGIDIEQDLVRAVAGTPRDGLVGETIAGFDSLHITARVTFADLPGRLAKYLKKSQEHTYQKEFGWIDHVREVRDPKLKENLTRALVKELKSGRPCSCWMVPDGIIDWNEVTYFQYGTAHGAPRFSHLDLEQFLDHLGGRKKLTPASLEKVQVRALRADDQIAHHWPAERCLQAELQFNQTSYLLNSGKWYQVDHDFVKEIDQIVRVIPECHLGLPEYRDASEGKYNERAARESGDRLALLDANTVRHGGSQSQIEVCDLYSIDRDMIHVKRYSSSGALSHLFSQASVSGQSFKSDAAFRKKVNDKLPASHRLADFSAPVEQDQYRVVVAIVDGPGSCDKLPFFSRITLKNTYKLLGALGYRVAATHVPLEAQFAVTQSLRERTRRRRRKAAKRAGG